MDMDGNPLWGVQLCQVATNYCRFTDMDGIFHYEMDPCLGDSIVFFRMGYCPVFKHIPDTLSDPLNINFPEIGLDSCTHLYTSKRHNKFGFVSAIQIDVTHIGFSEFEPLFGTDNIDLMNKPIGALSIEVGTTYKRYYAGFNFGFSTARNYEPDSLDIKFNTTQYGLHFAYNLINSRRFLITPKVAIKWNRYRLINSDKDRQIPIEQYISDRDLDVRWNQLTGFVGLNLSYKLYENNFLSTDFWTVGIYGGYYFRLTDKPWIYSKCNRLISDSKIHPKKFNIGLYFSFHFE